MYFTVVKKNPQKTPRFGRPNLSLFQWHKSLPRCGKTSIFLKNSIFVSTVFDPPVWSQWSSRPGWAKYYCVPFFGVSFTRQVLFFGTKHAPSKDSKHQPDIRSPELLWWSHEPPVAGSSCRPRVTQKVYVHLNPMSCLPVERHILTKPASNRWVYLLCRRWLRCLNFWDFRFTHSTYKWHDSAKRFWLPTGSKRLRFRKDPHQLIANARHLKRFWWDQRWPTCLSLNDFGANEQSAAKQVLW